MISFRSGSLEIFTLESNIEDIRSLLRNAKDKDTVRRAAIILLVTAFETFVEGKLRDSFLIRMEKVSKPNDVKMLFNDVVYSWIYEQKRKPEEIQKFIEDGWKQIIINNFEKEIRNLNTPNSTSLVRLYKKFLGKELKLVLVYRGMSFVRICENLDALIALRGEVTHRSRKLFDDKKVIIIENELQYYLGFIERITGILEKI